MSDFRRQKGSALVVSLLILLVMTMLGVSAMQGSTLQERMVGNQKQVLETEWATEAGAVQAIQWLIQWLRTHPDVWNQPDAGQAHTALTPRRQRETTDEGLIYWIERLDWADETVTVVVGSGIRNSTGQVVTGSAITVVLQVLGQNADADTAADEATTRAASSRPQGNQPHQASSPKRLTGIVSWRLGAAAAFPDHDKKR